MPSTSKKQHNFMEAVANNPSFAKKVGVPQSVGKDFAEADKGKKFKGGARIRPDLQKVNEPKTLQGKTELFKKGGSMKMKETQGPRTMSQDVEKGSNKKIGFGQAAVQKRGLTKGKNLGDSGPTAPIQGMKKGGMSMKKMASGGFTRSADGVASKGKTKAMQVSMSGNKGMKKGGMAKKYC